MAKKVGNRQIKKRTYKRTKTEVNINRKQQF